MKDKIISLRLESKLYEDYKKLAYNMKLSVSQLLRTVLTLWLKRDDRSELRQLEKPLERLDEMEKWLQKQKKKSDQQFKKVEEEIKKVRKKITEE